jgi:hypothetical protein
MQGGLSYELHCSVSGHDLEKWPLSGPPKIMGNRACYDLNRTRLRYQLALQRAFGYGST